MGRVQNNPKAPKLAHQPLPLTPTHHQIPPRTRSEYPQQAARGKFPPHGPTRTWGFCEPRGRSRGSAGASVVQSPGWAPNPSTARWRWTQSLEVLLLAGRSRGTGLLRGEKQRGKEFMRSKSSSPHCCGEGTGEKMMKKHSEVENCLTWSVIESARGISSRARKAADLVG